MARSGTIRFGYLFGQHDIDSQKDTEKLIFKNTDVLDWVLEMHIHFQVQWFSNYRLGSQKPTREAAIPTVD